MLSISKDEQEDLKKAIKPPVFIETESLNDLARLVCALERVPLPLFSIKTERGIMFATQIDLFMGIPVFYYAYSGQFKHFLGYRTTQNGEEVMLVDTPANSAIIHSPVIEIEKMPSVFETGLARTKNGKESIGTEKFLSLQVKDAISLVKIASYKILFDEPPMPIFAFPNRKNDKWCVGTFARTEDYDEASVFFYYEQGTKPEHNFIRYSMNKAEVMMTNRTDEHGFVYIKIIKLREHHPLVDA